MWFAYLYPSSACWYLRKSEKAVGAPGARVTGISKTQYECLGTELKCPLAISPYSTMGYFSSDEPGKKPTSLLFESVMKFSTQAVIDGQ